MLVILAQKVVSFMRAGRVDIENKRGALEVLMMTISVGHLIVKKTGGGDTNEIHKAID